MLRGIIGPKGRPGFLHPYLGGVLDLQGERRFVVDDDPAAKVIDHAGETLVLTRMVYDEVRAEIAAGAPMLLEPATSDLGDDAREEIGALRARLEQIEQDRRSDRDQFDSAYRSAQEEITRLQGELDAANKARVKAESNLEAQLAAVGHRDKVIADLEQQLAAAQKPAADKPAADKPAADKPAKK